MDRLLPKSLKMLFYCRLLVGPGAKMFAMWQLEAWKLEAGGETPLNPVGSEIWKLFRQN